MSVDGIDWGIFDKLTGGNKVDSAEKKYNPGGAEVELSLGGRVQHTNSTVARLYDLDRDHPRIDEFRARLGKGWAVITKQPLDVNGNAKGKPEVHQGTVKSVESSDYDSNADGEGLLTVEITTVSVT